MSAKLHERALECVKNYKKGEKQLLEILEAIDRQKSYLDYGVSSLFRYCVERLSLSEAETYRFIQVMRKASQVPELKAAIDSGLLTVSKASRIAPVITKENEKKWIEKASTLRYRELEREIAKERPEIARKERIKAITPLRSEIRFSISAELEMKFERVKEILRTKTMEETLEELVDYAIQQKDPVERAKRINNRKTPVKPAARQANVAKQTSRPIPQRILHQVNLRDRGKCTVKDCQETRWVEIHHVRPFSQGGTHALNNLTTLCSGHHGQIHGHQGFRWKRPIRQKEKPAGLFGVANTI